MLRLCAALLILILPAPAADQADADKETFLRTAKIASLEQLREGVTKSRRAELLSETGRRHAAHIQVIDRTIGGVRDYYAFNAVAYRLDRLLGVGLVPVSVLREVEGRTAAVTWWVDDFLMLERQRWEAKLQPPDIRDWNGRMLTARVFTELTANADANLGNIVIDRGWRIWLIDFTRAFRPTAAPDNPEQMRRISRELLDRLRSLNERWIEQELGDLLDLGRRRALLQRRDRIVAHFDALIAREGETGVLLEAPAP